MISGVNFQPGQTDPTQGTKKKPAGDQGVQEAIKVLSLRMPRVVGAQSVAPAPLLNSPGSGGNRVDSVVNQVLGRMMPTGQPSPQAPSAPMMPPPQASPAPPQSGPDPVRFEGVPRTPMMRDMVPEAPWTPPPGFAPRVVVDNPTPGDFTVGLPGTPYGPGGPGGPGGVIEPAPRFDDGSSQPPASIAPGPGGNPFADLLDYLRRQQPAPTPPSDISAPMI